jgi:hypothetical protein
VETKQQSPKKTKTMKSLFQPAVIAMIVVVGLTSCKKESMQPAESTVAPEIGTQSVINPNITRQLQRKGTDSLVYNADGSLAKVIYSPTKYVAYSKSGNVLTAKTFESNVLKLQVDYTLNNGRTTKSVHTSWQSNVGVSKTWLYDYDNNGRISQKYNKDNWTERINFNWIGADNLHNIQWYSGSNQHVATLLFTRNQLVDKIKINSPRSSLDPYLKVFGTRCGTLSTGEDMVYPLSPASNFKESHTFTFDRDGYPVKVEVRDPENNWQLKYTHTFSYVN